MKIRFFSEADEWGTEGPKINSPENLEAIRKACEENGPIIVEHRFYRGASRPDHIAFDEWEDFEEYLNTKASAGDNIFVWNFHGLCTTENMLVKGKCPDDQGRVPRKGAY